MGRRTLWKQVQPGSGQLLGTGENRGWPKDMEEEG